MSMPIYVSPEQWTKDKADYARKGIARGRPLVVLEYTDGIVLVTENPSSHLHKLSELYDRIAFAAVGRFSEFENLRVAGVRIADIRGYTYGREDVTGRAIANAYSQMLTQIFMEASKAYEVEVCVAEVGIEGAPSALYHIVYDGTVDDRKGFLAMGGEADDLNAELQRQYREGMALDESIRLALKVLRRAAPAGAVASRLEVAVLERSRRRRSFRRLTDDEVAKALETETVGAATGGGTSSGSAANGPGAKGPDGNGPASGGPGGTSSGSGGNGPASGGSGASGSGGKDPGSGGSGGNGPGGRGASGPGATGG
jgi:proteasome alpha subunit